jgi:hypothetical protein
VLRIHTGAITTEMVELQAWLDGTDELLVCEAVCFDVAIEFGHPEDAVACLEDRASPFPAGAAAVVCDQVSPETLLRGKRRWTATPPCAYAAGRRRGTGLDGTKQSGC